MHARAPNAVEDAATAVARRVAQRRERSFTDRTVLQRCPCGLAKLSLVKLLAPCCSTVSVRALDAVEAALILIHGCRASTAARELRDAAFVVAEVGHNGVTAVCCIELHLVTPGTPDAGKFVLRTRLVAGLK